MDLAWLAGAGFIWRDFAEIDRQRENKFVKSAVRLSGVVSGGLACMVSPLTYPPDG